MDHRKISDHKLILGVPPHGKGHPHADYLTWRDPVKDQMLARGSVRYGAGRGGFSLTRASPYTGPGGVFFG